MQALVKRKCLHCALRQEEVQSSPCLAYRLRTACRLPKLGPSRNRFKRSPHVGHLLVVHLLASPRLEYMQVNASCSNPACASRWGRMHLPRDSIATRNLSSRKIVDVSSLRFQKTTSTTRRPTSPPKKRMSRVRVRLGSDCHLQKPTIRLPIYITMNEPRKSSPPPVKLVMSMNGMHCHKTCTSLRRYLD